MIISTIIASAATQAAIELGTPADSKWRKPFGPVGITITWIVCFAPIGVGLIVTFF